MRVALRRAAHQLFDKPPVLGDPIALPIVGEEAAAHLRAESRTHRGRIAGAVRAFMTVRSRLAEDELAQALARGVAQYDPRRRRRSAPSRVGSDGSSVRESVRPAELSTHQFSLLS